VVALEALDPILSFKVRDELDGVFVDIDDFVIFLVVLHRFPETSS